MCREWLCLTPITERDGGWPALPQGSSAVQWLHHHSDALPLYDGLLGHSAVPLPATAPRAASPYSPGGPPSHYSLSGWSRCGT